MSLAGEGLVRFWNSTTGFRGDVFFPDWLLLLAGDLTVCLGVLATGLPSSESILFNFFTGGVTEDCV